MRCYRCGEETLVLAPLWPYERTAYVQAGIVMRLCTNCGLEQNHRGHDEHMAPIAASQEASEVNRPKTLLEVFNTCYSCKEVVPMDAPFTRWNDKMYCANCGVKEV